MNEVKLSGRALDVYSVKDAIIVKMAVFHEHTMGDQKLFLESIFTIIMNDFSKFKTMKSKTGDNILVEGYIKQDFSKSGHSTNKIYATSIKTITKEDEL